MCSTTATTLSGNSRCSSALSRSSDSGMACGVRRGQYARDILSSSSKMTEKWGVARVLKDR